MSRNSFDQKKLTARIWDWQSIVLVIVLVEISSVRLVISEWVPNLAIVQIVSLCAVVLGLLLGHSNFTRKISSWIACEYALLVIPAQLLSTITKADRSGVYSTDLRNFLLRIFSAILLFLKNQPIHDTLFFILITSIGFWLIGCYVGYCFARHGSFLEVILCPGLVMVIVQIYDPWIPSRAWSLAFFIFISLILLGRVHYLENKKVWAKKQIFLGSDIEQEFTRSIFYSAAVMVFIAWALPGAISSIKPISKAWHNFTEPFNERFSNAVTALDAPYGTSTSGDFYGSELALGNNAPVSNTPVLFINAPKSGNGILRYYWRGRTYDTYQDGQWANSNSQRINFDPGANKLDFKDSANRVAVDVKVTVNFQKQELLYAPSEATWFSRAGKLFIGPMGEENTEVLGMVADPGLVTGDSYEVRAMIATPSIEDLRKSGTQYPAWVSERYTQVPSDLAPQLKKLAEKITQPYTNPFDKAQAITSYLRTTIQYQTTISETAPIGKDPLLWVLFDYKKGFCLYSASAEVLMLRTLGIPARMAVGFAQGKYDSERGRYTVARLDAHAWPEVYFPGEGWIEFEPTGNQQPLDRPQQLRNDNVDQANTNPTANNPLTDSGEGKDNSSGFNPSLNETDQSTLEQPSNQLGNFITIILALIFIVLVVMSSKRYAIATRLPVYLAQKYSQNGTPPPGWLAYWVYWTQLLPIEKHYQTINLCLRWLGIKQPSHHTPKERADALTRILPSAGIDIENLNFEYQNAIFTSHATNLASARNSSLKILYKALHARIFHYKEIAKRRYN